MKSLVQSFTRVFGVAVLAATMGCALGASAQAAEPTNFYVPLNRSELVSSNTDISEALIGDPDVANVVVHGKRRVSVLGIEPGQTTLRLFDGSHRLIRSMDIYVVYDLPAIRRAIKQFLPNEHIGVSMVNTRIALTGEVTSASAAANAMEIAEEFVHGKLSADAAEKREARSGKELSPVINLMKISAGQQVMLRIRVGEVQRSAIHNLGISLQAFTTDAPNILLGTGIGRLVSSTSSTTGSNGSVTSSTTGGFQFKGLQQGSDAFADAAIYSKGSTGVGAALEALERDGLVKVLAEPTLTALSGEEAQFLAGGEFPIPVPQQYGQITLEYKPFGVSLKFIPYVLSKNRIRIQVQPEVSEISTQNQVNISGYVAPSIVTRRASTTLELAPGESFMLAGLLQDDMSSTIDQLPGAGDIPILGALFRSTAYQRKETELVIAVTPYIVDPIRDADVKLPTDDLRPATFLESIFFGALASSKGTKDPSLEGPAGFMTDN